METPEASNGVISRIQFWLQHLTTIDDLEWKNTQLATQIKNERVRRSAAEEFADERREHLDIVLDTLAMGTWQLSPAGEIILDNRSAALMGTLTQRRMPWKDFIQLLHPLDGTEIPTQLDSKIFESTVQSLAHDNESQHILLLKGAARNDGRGYGTLRCVTESYQQQRQLQESERFRDLGLLASSVAHDFNNHLAVVSGAVESLQLQDLITDELREPLKVVNEAVEQSAGIVQNLLALARGEKHPIHPVNTAQLIKEHAH